ncbi:hypothetical protein Pcinc_009433 [Petrolisthes cinctipes]|uniref:Uncharacterized protein n=1 Tax=Petrolisthes cinctipes TaxID=88211 RepID=A0AAE1G724_PETCI|nr:hypothetical protein Pcinc_009433 [Petrolisthes cinctipes]
MRGETRGVVVRGGRERERVERGGVMIEWEGAWEMGWSRGEGGEGMLIWPGERNVESRKRRSRRREDIRRKRVEIESCDSDERGRKVGRRKEE